MHSQPRVYELPLQPRQRDSPLTYYPPPADSNCPLQDLQSDLPCQLSGNPYQSHRTNFRLPTVSNHSLSKWAFTEISTQDQKEDDSVLPIFHDLPTEAVQLISEATFKPKDLKEHLRGSCDLKKMLRQTLEKDQIRVVKSIPKKEKGKTRYQKILEEYFQRDQKEKPKISQQKVRDIKQRYPRTTITACPIQSKVQVQTHRLSHRVLPTWKDTHRHCQDNKDTGKLTKTFSQKVLSERTTHQQKNNSRGRQSASTGRQSWMQMNFVERQRKVIENRRDKQNKGQKLNIQREIRECTFKPKTRAYQGIKHEETAGSYAKLYFQRIQRRK